MTGGLRIHELAVSLHCAVGGSPHALTLALAFTRSPAKRAPCLALKPLLDANLVEQVPAWQADGALGDVYPLLADDTGGLVSGVGTAWSIERLLMSRPCIKH